MLLSVEDKELVKGLNKGDRAAFNALYDRYYSGVFKNICKLIHKYEVAEDILQEVFLSLWNNRSSLDPDQSIGGWLFVVSYHSSLKWLKANIREHKLLQRLVEPEPVVSDLPEEDVLRAQMTILHAAIEELPKRKKQAFKLCKLEGKTYEEAGRILGVSAMTVQEYVKTSSQTIRKSILSRPDYSSLVIVTGLAVFTGL